MHWVSVGLILFGFSAPSGVVGIPYALGSQGVVVGILLCLLATISTAIGATFVAELAYKYQEVTEFKDLGLLCGGSNGQLLATVVQNFNFILFLPVGMDLVAEALQGILNPSMNGCTDYFILGVASLCLATTQIRTFTNAEPLSYLMLVCAVAVGVIFIWVSATVDNPDYKSVYLFGNPDGGSFKGVIEALLGVTTVLWCYVPAFIVVELKEALKEKDDMMKAIVMSAVIQIVFYISIGTGVVINWGWYVDDPLMLMSAWPTDSVIGKATNILIFISNLITYALCSVPLTRKYVQWMSPKFEIHDWSIKANASYLWYSIQPWFVALLISILAPSVFLIVAFVTALTVPLVSLILPGHWYIVDTMKDSQVRNPSSIATVSRYGVSIASATAGPYDHLDSCDADIVKVTQPLADSIGSGIPSVEDGSASQSVSQSPNSNHCSTGKNDSNVSLNSRVQSIDSECSQNLTIFTEPVGYLVAQWLIVFGIVSFGICLVAAVGQSMIPSQRGELQVGCNGWKLFEA